MKESFTTFKLCQCLKPRLVADSEGKAVCEGCGHYFNKEHWDTHWKERVNKAVKNQKIGRNDPCQCGSGKKFKKCCFIRKIVGLAIREVETDVSEKQSMEVFAVYDNNTAVRQNFPFKTTLTVIQNVVKFFGQVTIYVDRTIDGTILKEIEDRNYTGLVLSDPAAMKQDFYDKYKDLLK